MGTSSSGEPAQVSVVAARVRKRVRWRVPAGGKRRPGVLDATRAELVRGLEQRQGCVWHRISRTVIVAGYPIDRALNRVRSLRADGAESLLAMTVALLYLADVRTGFVGKPSPERGPWMRYALPDLAQLAYGAQGEAELRRARRSIDALISIGWIFPTKQVRRHQEDGSFRSEPAVRRLNLTRLCQMTGTSWLLNRDRQHADRTRGPGTAPIEASFQRPQEPQQAACRTSWAMDQRRRPAATGDPSRSAGGLQAIANILGLLGKS